MPASKTPDLAREHGTALDKHAKKVRCSYCSKVISGFYRLKLHLGGMRGDVSSCKQVPSDLKSQIRDLLLETKKQNLGKQVGQLYHPDLPWKRNFIHKPPPPTSMCSSAKPTNAVEEKVVCSDPNNTNGATQNAFSQQSKSKEQDHCKNAQRSIARFFCDSGIPFSAAKSPFYQDMIDAAVACGPGFEAPGSYELGGSILREVLKDVDDHVKDIKSSWERTGCSILLNGWTTREGRTLLVFLVDCPEGMMFLKSVDASDWVGDVDTLFSLLEGVVKEVGVENVVQVVTDYNASSHLEAAGKRLVEKHTSVFWNVCAAHCIDLMLEEIRRISFVRKLLDKAMVIIKLAHRHSTIWKLLRRHMPRSVRTRSQMLFLTLQNIVSEKENLRNMFYSSAWNTSTWAFTAGGKRVAHLVWEPSFWAGAEEVLNSTIPLIRVLGLIDGDDKPTMAYLYDAIDQAKETIRKDLGYEEAKYMPIWTTVDAIWNNQLHCPLHSAGYFLNPAIFYSSRFYGDSEVAGGLMCCIERMVPDLYSQNLLFLQLDEYRGAEGVFASKTAIEQRTKILPDKWWSWIGGHAPQLQRFALRILSQTCTSRSSRYELNKSLIEQLHTKGWNKIDQERLRDVVFVHANLRLWHSRGYCRNSSRFGEDIEVRDDWTDLDHADAEIANDDVGDIATSIKIEDDLELGGGGGEDSGSI